MTTRLAVAALVGMLMAPTLPAMPQQWRTPAEATHAQLRTTLRAFYFSLAHQDWTALSSDVLPAKVVAHRPAPEAFVAPSKLPARPARLVRSVPAADDPPACSAHAPALVDKAVITLEGDWAEVSVPRCVGTPLGADEFRFIHFDGRWWIVHIQLVRSP
jgi:hypothetical protein